MNAGDELLLNTYGFGGGANYAGTVIPDGGFDPFVGLFSGTGSTALFIKLTAIRTPCPTTRRDVRPPEAVFESAPAYLADAFVDLTGGVFQTCYDAADCNNDTGNWAVDISAPEGSFKIVTPEPAPFGLAGFGLAIVVGLALSKRKVTFCKFN